jgi:uncharacterized protein (TIGR02600 family)
MNFSTRSSGLPTQSRSGIALVIVLAIIVLITALVVSFLEQAGSERSSAASYSTTSVTRRLTDTAVNLVQGQINQATTRGNTYCWASQPGAIRVFDDSGNLDSIYRLYSAYSLSATGAKSSDLANDIPPEAWAEAPARWVDLNAPAKITGTNQLAYPILDIRNPSHPSTNLTKDFGIDIQNAPGATTIQPTPMPVQWLYVLQNGEILAADPGGTGTSAAFTYSTVQPSRRNPIIGRIAFWTDDETCKVNINTAGGDGSNNLSTNTTDNTAIKAFWDAPHYMTVNTAYDDGLFGVNQPASHEYQRYPGHPATTSLKSILQGLGLTNLTTEQLYGPQATEAGTGITPRYSNGGSLGATRGPLSISGSWQITPRADRLYPSVGELLFQPSRTVLTNATKQQVETANFFLTANSRAPELNLFGQPRISMWPVSASTGTDSRTPIDQLLAFCGTVGGNPYYFTRQDNKSQTTDITLDRNAKLLQYLDRITQRNIPGFGGSFDTKYPALNGTSERRQILTEIFDYIRVVNLHDSTVAKPYAAAAPKLSTTAGEGQVLPSYHANWNTQGFGRYYQINEVSLIFVALGTGNSGADAGVKVNLLNPGLWHSDIVSGPDGGTVPSQCTAIRAFLVFSVFDPAMGFSWILPDSYMTAEGLEGFSVVDSAGNTIPLGFPSGADITPAGIYNPNPYGKAFQDKDQGGSVLGGYESFRFLFAQRHLSNKVLNATMDARRFPFYSNVIPVKNTSGKFTLKDTTIKIHICAPITTTAQTYNPGVPAASQIVQTYEVEFPDSEIPIPTLFDPSALIPYNSGRESKAPASPPFLGGTSSISSYPPCDQTDRWYNVTMTSSAISATKGTNLLAKGDVMRSMVLSKGDIRLLARKTVSKSAFSKTLNYDNLSVPIESGNALSNARMLGTSRGKLVPNATYNPCLQPIVPDNVTNGAMTAKGALGDWDNGISNAPDGPYINRADEGVKPESGVANPYKDTYFNLGERKLQLTESLFSPNRQVPSAVMLGSLPTGVIHNLPWQTLLFHPGPGAAGLSPKHPGEADMAGDGTSLTGAPADHLWLDLFWMPIAEPYAISEPASTAGKVNLNYKIVPFSYISRTTAIRAVLASEKIAAVSTDKASRYKLSADNLYEGKSYSAIDAGLSGNARVPIDISETLKQFDEKFTQTGDHNIFRSASEICDIFLVPQGYTRGNFPAKWYDTSTSAPFGLVGDNVRERPYAHIYPRVTTKSNTYTVYYTVQALKNPSADPSVWNEKKGVVTGEFRGSTMLERYIDPNESALKNSDNDFATSSSDSLSMEKFYRWRVIRNDQFCP